MLWEDTLLSHFLVPESLTSLMSFYCKQTQGETKENASIDAISSTVVMFLNSPIQLSLNDLGVSFFQHKSSCIYPYYLLSETQKAALVALLQHPAEYNFFNERIVFKRGHTPLAVPPLRVLQSLCLLVFGSKYLSDHESKEGVCNIIMQRIQGYVSISNTIRKDLNAFIQTQITADNGRATLMIEN